jgi:DNA-binding response OmpR family regulator
VKDTGPGIPIEQLDHVFDRFYQAEATYEHHQKGSGIGLALSKELVELHHGTIEAKSKRGYGSEFIVRLPKGAKHLKPEMLESINNDSNAGEVAAKTQFNGEAETDHPELISSLELLMEEPDGSTAAEMPDGYDILAEEAGEGEREDENVRETKSIILVVEDSADLRNYIRGALETDYRVIEASDGSEGIEKALEVIPDLIISDVMMPNTDGYELCANLKKNVNTSHIPIVLLTAKAAEDDILEGFETGADDYVTKPFSTAILTARIKNLIQLRKRYQTDLNREMTLKPVQLKSAPIDKEFLKDLKAVIEEHLDNPDFSVEELSNKLYMGRTSLYRKIQALSGETPTDFIRTYRLKRAAELLRSSNKSVIDIAFDVGFSSATYFTKCFKKQFHQLPKEYQKNNM